jgi:hypothetical protein
VEDGEAGEEPDQRDGLQSAVACISKEERASEEDYRRNENADIGEAQKLFSFFRHVS